jgi:hypothetical protein
MRIRLHVLAAVVLAAVIAHLSMPAGASAQDLNRRPSVSPYLNLLIPDQFGIPGGNPGQYQTLVEPFVEGRKAAQNNQNQLNRLNAQVNGGARGGGGGGSFGAGGYHSRYMNYSHYYSGIRR